MSAQYLGQVLLLQTHADFTDIVQVMKRLGFTREDMSNETRPFMQDEPEFASWSMNGIKPFVIYTFNPIVSLRVLDVATVPPMLRMAIAKELPLLDEQLISKYFESDDIKKRLLALWAAQETERVDLLGRVEILKQDSEQIISSQAEEISERLQTMNQSRENMLIQLKVLSETAPVFIQQMRSREFIESLKPTEDDLKKLFDENLIDACKHCVDTIYEQPLPLPNIGTETLIEAVACPAGLLRWSNMLSEKFPTGYRDIAGWMTPNRIWLTWTIGAVRYDGLVYLDNKWIWLPKIFRFLTPYLISSANASLMRH